MHNKNLLNIYHFIDNLNTENIVDHNKNKCIIYRNYDSKLDSEKLLNFKNFCKKKNFKFLISNEIDLAFKLKLDGVYLPILNRLKDLKFNSLNGKEIHAIVDKM